MIQVELMHYAGLPQVIKKTLEKVRTLDGSFRQPLTRMSPQFDIDGSSGQLQGLLMKGGVNYAKIENRYYYLMDWSTQPNNIIRLSLQLDVLKTHEDVIINKMGGILDRSSTATNKDLHDSMYPISAHEKYDEIYFEKSFKDDVESGIYTITTSQASYKEHRP